MGGGEWCSCKVRKGNGRVVEDNSQLVASFICWIFIYSRKWVRSQVLEGHLVWRGAVERLIPLLVCYC